MIARTLLLMMLLAGAGGRALAQQHFAEALTREEIAAAGKAARERLPPVDKAKNQACMTQYQPGLESSAPAHTAATLAAAAACWRDAGALGLAIRVWTMMLMEFHDAPESREARRALAAAYEASGSFVVAAERHREYARLHPGEPDAREHLVRAVCIYRQLDFVELAIAAEHDLARLPPKKKLDSSALCATVRPMTPAP